MEIEKEIKQKKFSSIYHKAAINILFTGSWLNLRTSQYLKNHGLTHQQFNILRILRGQHPKPATVTLLIERMIDKTSNASRIVERLRQRGLVAREICEKDRRSVDVLITDKGLELLDEIDKHMDEIESPLRNLSGSEVNSLNELLNKVRSNDNI